MASRGKVALWGFVILGTLMLLVARGYFALSRAIRTLPVEPFATVLEKTVSDAVVLKQKNDLATRETPLPGTLAAYEQNPGIFKADAKLFEAWLSAIQLSTSVLEHGPNGNWVKSSSDLDYVKAEKKVDPWGHSLCVLRRGDAVLVISGGPSAPGSPSCKDVHLTEDELAKFPQRKLLQSQSGSLMLVALGRAPVAPSELK